MRSFFCVFVWGAFLYGRTESRLGYRVVHRLFDANLTII